MTPDDTLPVNPTLAPHTPPTTPDAHAGQGPMPDALPDAPPVPAPSTDGLNAQEVATLIGGGDASRAEANEALASAEGLDDPSES
ncbi:hypothetical protein [Deinococcus soli (ex Cha et al. 2016)]|jgi:hypothetical protein|uniref:Uncharacterized protein n=1 Tax=Deinococcus soli (ex Cha et al. 2016) TaxID=1309411 RepID=A0A0F7JQL0_9DEIO|nr:hypothetical protein [Deinococcus soli (ex Cha et al. 2016)]AKH16795.1 hypothetical protein SY84_06715 [Deinococcus soli (ex Cha et al. 2016)]